MGRSRGGLTTKIHARVDAKGRPVRILISPGNDHDVAHAEPLLDGLDEGAVVIADKGYDADRVRSHIKAQGARGNIPNRSNRKRRYRWTKAIYRLETATSLVVCDAPARSVHAARTCKRLPSGSSTRSSSMSGRFCRPTTLRVRPHEHALH